MKSIIRPITPVLIAFAMLVASAAPAAHAQKCSMSGAVGAYGFTGTGTLLLSTGPVLIAAVGRINLRADGSLDGTEARNVGGDFANEALKGTWTLNPSCTGTLTAEIFESGVLVRTSVLSFVADDNMEETRNVQKSLTLPDGTNVPAVITFEAKRIF
jgi:hypothetical protein